MKYFGIGISRTATSSLADAFKMLGYKSKHYLTKSQYDEFFRKGTIYDFVNDIPIYSYYQALDKQFPNSKFIYTKRNIQEWKDSCLQYFPPRMNTASVKRQLDFFEFWQTFFKCKNATDVKYEEIYQQHEQQVLEYFKDRPDDLLVMDITKGDGWEVLCPFIGCAIPNVPFPLSNKNVAKR